MPGQIAGNLTPTPLDRVVAFRRNGWSRSIGMAGRLPSDQVVAFARNRWSPCLGFRKTAVRHDTTTRPGIAASASIRPESRSPSPSSSKASSSHRTVPARSGDGSSPTDGIAVVWAIAAAAATEWAPRSAAASGAVSRPSRMSATLGADPAALRHVAAQDSSSVVLPAPGSPSTRAIRAPCPGVAARLLSTWAESTGKRSTHFDMVDCTPSRQASCSDASFSF